jgi:hypothetical protein
LPLTFFCKAFDAKIEKEVASTFDIEKISAFPTLLAFLPNSLLKNEYALKLFRKNRINKGPAP